MVRDVLHGERIIFIRYLPFPFCERRSRQITINPLFRVFNQLAPNVTESKVGYEDGVVISSFVKRPRPFTSPVDILFLGIVFFPKVLFWRFQFVNIEDFSPPQAIVRGHPVSFSLV